MSSEIEKKLWRRVNKYSKWMANVPFIRMISICNNLAIGNIDEKSDIDLFIISRSNRLFLSRFMITALLHLLGVRRHGHKISGRFCLSFFIDDEHLSLKDIRIENDIYLALWISTQLPVVNDGVFCDFINNNNWINEYQVQEVQSSPILKKSLVKKFFEFLFDGHLGDFIEKILMNWQIKRSRKKSRSLDDEANIVISKHMLKFHNIDRRAKYRDLWYQKYDKSVPVRSNFFKSL